MASEWRSSTWGKEISLEYGKALRGYVAAQGKYRVFGSNGPIGWTSDFLAPGPGVILGRKGAYRGVNYSADPFFVIDTAYYVLPKSELDMRWLYYAIRHHKLGEIDDGSPIPSTTRAAVYVRDLDVPSPPEQRAIADILGTLDDKIELNRRMNETLQAMAWALFKSWFVDFDPVRAEGPDPELPPPLATLFPNEFEDSELGEIPKGWSVSTLGQVTTKIGSGATPRGGGAVYVDDGIALIRSQNVYDSRFVWDGLAHITEAAAAALQGVTVEPEDILLNITGASILRTCIVGLDVLPARVNQHVSIIRPMSHVPSRYIHFHLLRPSTKAFLMGMDAGASRQAVTKAHIESVPLILPPAAVLDKFASLVRAPFSAIDNNNLQSRTIAALRDTLLPKLISGDLRIENVERFLEDRI